MIFVGSLWAIGLFIVEFLLNPYVEARLAKFTLLGMVQTQNLQIRFSVILKFTNTNFAFFVGIIIYSYFRFENLTFTKLDTFRVFSFRSKFRRVRTKIH